VKISEMVGFIPLMGGYLYIYVEEIKDNILSGGLFYLLSQVISTGQQ
jgi:hypothetical protein